MSRSALALAALLACIVGLSFGAVYVNPHNGETFYFNEPHYNVPPNATVATWAGQEACICSDADPRSDDLVVTYNCYHQALYGNCDAPFMALSTEELTEVDGYCMMSCGRCDCCTSAYDVVTKTGNTKFLAALGNITADDIPSYLKMPGLVGTLLAPSDAAWTAAEKKYGSELYDPDVLLEVFKYHFLPPEPRTKGLWTTPFLALGAKIYTSSDAVSTITSSKHVIPKNTTILGGITGIKLTGVSNSATIVTADLNACKVVVNIIDEVLWPFDLNTTTGSDGSSKISTALGLGNCDPLPNAEINATILVEGSANRLATPGACCDACEAHVGCNVWSYCPLAGGCRFPDGTTLLFGECTLQRSAELAAGSPLVWSDSGFAAVPTLSGYISNIAESTARANAPKAGTKSETAAAEASSSVNTSIIN